MINKKEKFTPGPWENISGGGNWEKISEVVADKNCRVHIEIEMYNNHTYDECKANSALIAAAPEMLETLQVMIKLVEKYVPEHYLNMPLINAKDIVKKALGE